MSSAGTHLSLVYLLIPPLGGGVTSLVPSRRLSVGNSHRPEGRQVSLASPSQVVSHSGLGLYTSQVGPSIPPTYG